jgi:hypothetical protein
MSQKSIPPNIPPKDNIQFTRRELATRWRVTARTVKRREQSGIVKSLKMGRSVRYRLSDILVAEENGL